MSTLQLLNRKFRPIKPLLPSFSSVKIAFVLLRFSHCKTNANFAIFYQTDIPFQPTKFKHFRNLFSLLNFIRQRMESILVKFCDLDGEVHRGKLVKLDGEVSLNS